MPDSIDKHPTRTYFRTSLKGDRLAVIGIIVGVFTIPFVWWAGIILVISGLMWSRWSYVDWKEAHESERGFIYFLKEAAWGSTQYAVIPQELTPNQETGRKRAELAKPVLGKYIGSAPATGRKKNTTRQKRNRTPSEYKPNIVTLMQDFNRHHVAAGELVIQKTLNSPTHVAVTAKFENLPNPPERVGTPRKVCARIVYEWLPRSTHDDGMAPVNYGC